MDETMKNRIIMILSILTVIFLILSIGSCIDGMRMRNLRDKEITVRLDLEEKMSKFLQEKTTIENKANAQEKELEEEKAAHQATKKALVQEQLVNQSLKEELQKVSKLKEALEEDLKEALVTGKKPKK
jgi:hypothetical protein